MMKENVKNSLNAFLEKITPEELDSLLVDLNIEYDDMFCFDTAPSFSFEMCEEQTVVCKNDAMTGNIGSDNLYGMAA